MAFEKYGGYIWSDEPAYQQRDWRMQGLSLGVAAGIGATAFGFATRVRPDGTRLLDDVATYARTGGNMLPFQLGNTYRVPEFLSPFTSPAYQGMESGTDGIYSLTIGKEYLQTKSTYAYIKQLTGLSESELASKGFKIGGDATETASSLVFERTAQSAQGSLYSLVNGEKRLLSDSVLLQQFTGESPDLINIVDKTKSVNRAAHATMQAMDMWATMDKFEPGDVLRRIGDAGDDELTRPKFFPVPGVKRKITSVDDLWRSSTLARAVPAFSMERFNRLVGGLSEEVFGSGTTEFLKRVTGAGAGVTPGPASHMFMRFGGKAALALGVGVGVQQLDWIRRQYDFPGEVAASVGLSGGLAWLAKKGKLSARTALFTGVASFAGQMILPGFDKGVVPGIATTWTRATELRGTAVNPFNYYRRTIEGFVPGATDWKTGALLGIGALSLSYGNLADALDPITLMGDKVSSKNFPFATVPASGKPLSQMILDRVGPTRFGLPADTQVKPTVRQLFWKNMLQDTTFHQGADATMLNALQHDFNAAGGYLSSSLRMRLMKAYRKSGFEGAKLHKHMNQLWAEAEELHKNMAAKNPVGDALLDALDTIGSRYSGKSDIFSKIGMQVEGLAAQWKHAFFGADLANEEVAKGIKLRGFKAPLGRLGLIFGGTLLAHQIVTGGLMGSMETSQELKDIYSGRELVEVGKSRWWEGGGTPFEGSKTSYYRPHWYALMMNRVREKGIWGEDEDEISPVGKFLRRNLTYELERRQYYDRPYPITSGAFSDIPIIGGALSATIGRVIKPPRLMHVNEWVRPGEDGEYEYGSVYEGWRREPAYNLGAIKPGVPSSPFSPVNQFSFINYQFRELEGLTGWTKNVLSDLIVGTDTYGTDRPQLQDAGYMTSHRLRFWENAMGGGFFMNEAIRRIFPNYRKEIERQNPIMNSMPAWLPEKYHYGDPYRAVEWGEARMPGPGYAALHPELRGVDPEDYPLIYQYDILANVAPFSKEFRSLRERLYRMRSGGMVPDSWNTFMDRIDVNVRDRYNVYDFDRVHDNAIQLPGSNITQAAYFYAQKTLRKGAAPIEYMIPMGFRPIQKLLGERDPIERYEFERLYGTPFAFWDQPWRDWLRPSIYSTMNIFGFESKPLWRKEADANAEYFDRLEFEKWMRLADQAGQQGNRSQQIRYQYMAGNTRMGVNPQGNPLSIYWSLPAEDRAYFNAFAFAQGRERERIKEMIPADQVHLYKAVWQRLDEGDLELFPGGFSGPDPKYLRDQFYSMGDSSPAPPDDWIGWHCLPSDQTVLKTLTSSENVGKIVPGDTVWQTDVSNQVLEIFSREVDEMILQITVERDRIDTMRATKDHKVLAWKSPWKKDHLRRRIKSFSVDNKFAPSWIRMKDLEPEDYLVIPIPGIPKECSKTMDLYDFKDIFNLANFKYDDEYVWTYYTYAGKQNGSLCSRYITLSPEVAWAIGYYMAEGHTAKRNGSCRYVEWTSSVDEIHLHEKLKEILVEVFDIRPTITIRKRKSGSCCTIRATGAAIGEFFNYFAPGVHDTKRLEHADYLFASQEHVEAFLAGLYAGDGSKESGSSTLTTTSEDLHRQVKEMLISCGVVPSVSLVLRKDRKPSYQIRFVRSCDAAKRIHDQIIPPGTRTRDISPAKPKAFVKDGHLYSRIDDICWVWYRGLVHDLNVDQVHAYRCPIGLYHNSDVDIRDIRVRYINELGKDLHDYGLWENQLKAAMSQPYLADSTQYLHDSGGINRAQISRDLYRMMDGPVGPNLFVNTTPFQVNTVDVEYNDNRDLDISVALREQMNGY